jgi:protein TonB
LVSAGAPGQNYYPAASKRLDEEGLVYVAVHVSAEGCPERATVTVSSGYPRLDATTLVMMLDSQFLPAAGDGQAVASDFVTVMKWELKD